MGISEGQTHTSMKKNRKAKIDPYKYAQLYDFITKYDFRQMFKSTSTDGARATGYP